MDVTISVPLEKGFQSTLPVWGGTEGEAIVEPSTKISIHPPRVGRDGSFLKYWVTHLHFNPPSPCGEGHHRTHWVYRHNRFQSTLPVWGGTF